jgi:hypothetical protein
MQSPTDNPTHYVPFVAPALLQHLSLTDGAKLTAATLLMHRNRETGYCYATEKTIALERGITDRGIRKNLEELKSHGLIAWEARKAPRGTAKGRGNSYDLSGLLDLCKAPILNAAEIAKRNSSSGKTRKTRNSSSSRERNSSSSHASDFRAIEQKQSLSVIEPTISDEPSFSDKSIFSAVTASANGKQVTIEGGERNSSSSHAARIAKREALSPSAIRQKLQAPNGTSAYDDSVCADVDAWTLANRVVTLAGGEAFNPGDLDKLIASHGSELVWFHAAWFPARIAALKSPPSKPTAFFVSSVREDYPIDPSWPSVDRDLPQDVWELVRGIGGSFGTITDQDIAF